MVMGSASAPESSYRPGLTTRAKSAASGTWDELALENVSMTFNPGKPNEYRALANTTIKVRRGEFYCLLGPSGCGKSTVLNLIAGFTSPSSGRIRIGERQVVGAGTDRVVVFQDATNALFPWLRAHEIDSGSSQTRSSATSFKVPRSRWIARSRTKISV
jgi:NitT/TauT family transport system ATP-binding protein